MQGTISAVTLNRARTLPISWAGRPGIVRLRGYVFHGLHTLRVAGSLHVGKGVTRNVTDRDIGTTVRAAMPSPDSVLLSSPPLSPGWSVPKPHGPVPEIVQR